MEKLILIIEDNEEIRENIAEILELGGYRVILAENGKEGIKMSHGERPDLIICDIMMPELDGYGVLHLLSKNAMTENIPFIFLTAKSEKIDFRKGMNMGADDYLTKPFDDVELLNAIETRLKKYELLTTQFSKNAEGLNEFINLARGVDELKKMSQLSKPKKYLKREVIYKEGERPNNIYFVNKGKVKSFKSNQDGKEYVTELHKEGDFIGYIPLLEDCDHQDSTMALEDSEIIMIPKTDFFSLLFNNKDVATIFIKMLSNSIVEKEDRLVKLAYNSVRKRLADALLIYRDRFKNETDDFSMAIPREDLASMVGTAIETVIRTLSAFKDENLIDIQHNIITITNHEKLAAMKN